MIDLSMKALLILILSLCVGCSSMKLSDYAAKTPQLNFKAHFLGRHEGSGAFFDRFGSARQRFTIALEGVESAQGFVLHEVLTYETGEVINRDYNIVQQSPSHFEATNPDIIGKATINTAGNAAQWKYVLKQKIGERVWNLSFDDWMFLNTDNSIINRATASIWGFRVGEVVMVLRKV
jgi:hypothetical protein